MSVLAEQEVRDDLLHLLVIGPRGGESVIVRAPGGECLVVDSLKPPPQGAHPVSAALQDVGGALRLLALTHPHEDHAAGFSELVDLAPTVGCVPAWVEGGTPPSFDLQDLASCAQDAHAAIVRAWEDPARRWVLAPTESSDQELGPARVEVLGPSAAEVAAALGSKKSHLNAASAAMRVTWQGCELVLGADLTTGGWQHVEDRRDGTAHQADGLKVSHHGSSTGHHAWALGAGGVTGGPRTNALTPYSSLVPSFDAGRDIELLHRHTAELHITSVPSVPAAVAHRLTAADVLNHRKGQGARGRARRRHPATHPVEDSWWLWAFDQDGRVTPVGHGASAKTLVV